MTPPVPNESMRIGDREREAMTDRLAKAHSLGQLTLDEFDERVTRTQAARTRGELEALDADLPRDRGDFTPRDLARRGRQGWRDANGRPRWGRIALIAMAVWLVTQVVYGVVFLVSGPHGHRGYDRYEGYDGYSPLAFMPVLIAAVLAFLVVRRVRRTRQRSTTGS